LLSLISGLLARVATELVVFLLGEGVGCVTGCSLDVEPLESHEKGLLNFLAVGAGAGGGTGAGAGAGGGVISAALAAGGLFDRESLA
jgi:hypothetical protein